MAFKVSSTRLIKTTKMLQTLVDAVNNLERIGGNKTVYLKTKKEAHDLIDELKASYDLENFDEWKDKKKSSSQEAEAIKKQ